MRPLLLLLLLPGVPAFLSNGVHVGHASWRPAGSHSSSRVRLFPEYVPSDISEIQESAALELARKMRRVPVSVPESMAPSAAIGTNFVETGTGGAKGEDPILMLHGFDSSLLEFRRLMPKLGELGADAYAVDVLGWGFTDLAGVSLFGAEAKRTHLLEFWKQVMGGRPMTLVGASLGGAIALDFAHEFPEAVKKLVLIDAQGFIDGSGPGASLPGPLAKLGISVLGSKPLRSLANQMSYTDKSLATEDAVRVGRLHTMCDGWAEASLQYMGSGGFTVSTKVPNIETETLVLWGRQDKILDPKLYAERFVTEMPNARLVWVDECGHVPHLEQPDETARAIMDFVKNGNPEKDVCSTCRGSELQACSNCDGQGSYKTYDVVVVCKSCKGSGNVLCRSCFTGDPWDIEAARTQAEERRKSGLLGFRKPPPPDGILQYRGLV
ncbi:unnamed protein product [Laminaria digitata]